MILNERKTGIDERKTDIHEFLTGIRENKTDSKRFHLENATGTRDEQGSN